MLRFALFKIQSGSRRFAASDEVFSSCAAHKMFSLCRGRCLLVTHWLVCECKDEERGPVMADCCASCVTQTRLKLNRHKSSMLFCQTKDTTFSCRWATSSLPSCCWSSSSSSSSSPHVDTSPKVRRKFCAETFIWHANIC